jgi:hypothetical protein
MNRRANNFGKWINFKLYNMNNTKAWLEKKAKLSSGSVIRYIKGTTPGIDAYFAVCSVIAKECRVEVGDIVKETLEYMPYLVSYQMEPKICPACGQDLKFQKNPRPNHQ